MAKRRFKTKLSRAQKRKNIRFFFIVFLGCYAFTLFFCYAIEVFEGGEPILEVLLMGLALTFFVLVMLLSPVIVAAFVLGVQMGKAKRVRDNVTFVPSQNIDYYRDILRELNPPTVSLLIDLDLYGQKDIAATLLRMQNKGVIAFQENGHITVTEQKGKNAALLDDSEKELLTAVSRGTLNKKGSLSTWKRNRFREAQKAGYIQKREDRFQKNVNKYAVISLVVTVVDMILWGFFMQFELYNYPIVTIVCLLVIGTVLFTPWYLVARESVYWKRGDVLWERTPLGNEMAEKIAGLSRFIHEFSMLSEANKEQVALWDEYLVYAVLLEENEKIVADICKKHKVNLRGFGVY
jgi:hypothetical protein